MKKVIAQVLVIVCLLTSFMVTASQAQGNATIDGAGAFADEKGQVTVYGHISSGPGQQVTIAVIDPAGGIAYTNSVHSGNGGDFLFSFTLTNENHGTYQVRLGGRGVIFPVTLTFYSPVALLDAAASVSGSGQVVVSGHITSGAGQKVTIDVTDPDGRPDYVDSTLSQADGVFVFSYLLTSRIIGTYHVKIGAEGIYNPVTVSFSYGTKSDDADLQDLELSAGSLDQAFAPGTTGYTATVPLDVNSVAVIPTTSDANATVQVDNKTVASGSESNAIDLAIGVSTINIVVTAQDGVTTKTYTVKVTRGDTLSGVTAQISQDKQVTVSGLISSGAGQVVSVVITDPNGNNEYVDSTHSGNNGNFSFSYPMQNTTPGTYTVKVGGENVPDAVTTSFNYQPPAVTGGGVVAATYTVSVGALPPEGGTVWGGGEYPVGATVTLTERPNDPYQFYEWTDQNGLSVESQVYTFTMPAQDVRLWAQFINPKDE